MFCDNVECSQIFVEQITCKHCKLAFYCSSECMQADWHTCHKFLCAANRDLKLTDFKVISLLGKGSSGEAYLTTHIKTAKQYAMKKIKKPSIPIEKKSVLREIHIHRQLRHTHIIKLFTYFEDDLFIYIILEYAEKGSLFNYTRNQQLTETQACSFFSEVSLGLLYLHKNMIIHRDLKPENILLDKNLRIKICDFGNCVQAKNKRNTFTGTLQFMAPEILNQTGYSLEVDLWALGIFLYELLHGKPPFNASFKNTVFPIQASKEASDLIRGLIRKNPEERMRLMRVLAHPWIQQHFTNHGYFVGQIVRHRFGIGTITAIQGLVCRVTSCGSCYEVPAPELHIETDLNSQIRNSNSSELSYYNEKEEKLLNTLEKICKRKKLKRAVSYAVSNQQIGNCDSNLSDKVMRSSTSTQDSKHFCNTEFTPEMLLVRQRELERLNRIIQDNNNSQPATSKISFWSKLFGCAEK